MTDFSIARRTMVDSQVRPSDVTDRRIQTAMLSLAREKFIPKAKCALAYADVCAPVFDGRVALRPRDLAKLVHALEVKEDDLVLDVACGRGYSTALLSQLSSMAVGLETDELCIRRASDAFVELGLDNAAVVQGDLRAGLPNQGPFDVILVNGAVHEPAPAWLNQLADGGRLGVIIQDGPVGRATIYQRSGGVTGKRVVFDAQCEVLPGFEKAKDFAF